MFVNHVDHDAAVVAEPRYHVAFGSGGRAADFVGHEGVVVFGGVEVDGKGAIGGVEIGFLAEAAGGVTVIAHDLSHGGGDAPDNSTGAVAHNGAVVVVAGALFPGGSEEEVVALG